MRTSPTICATLLAALCGCAADSVPSTAVTSCDAKIVPGVAASDVLFVVDDSGSMLGEQQELAENLGRFVNALVTSPVPLDVRIAVTNTSVVGYAGEATYADGGPAPAGTPYPAGTFVAIRRAEDGSVTPGAYLWDATDGWGGPRILSSNSMSGAELERDFRANVLVGAHGSGKEQPLRAMRLALEKAGQGGVNDGFLRPSARLAVVIITDEDDCSESIPPPFVGHSNTACHLQANKDAAFDPLADYVSFLDAPIQGEARDAVVAVVAGFDENGLPQGCSTMGGTSSYDDPTRLDDFLAAFDAAKPGRTFKDSICGSFGSSLLEIADRIIPQTMPLAEAPADWRMLAVRIDRADGTSTPCSVAEAGSSEASDAGAVFAQAAPGAPATLTFQNACRLGLGDRIDLRIVCAR